MRRGIYGTSARPLTLLTAPVSEKRSEAKQSKAKQSKASLRAPVRGLEEGWPLPDRFMLKHV